MNALDQPEKRQEVMIIDDEVDMCLFLKAYLMRKNYDVMIAHTVADAMPRIRMYKPDYVLLDCSSCRNIKKTVAEIEEAAPGVKVHVYGCGEQFKLTDYF